MPTRQAELLVLKKTKLAETDLIITAFSEEGTQVRAVVKGGRKPGSRLGAHLELFTRARVLLYSGRTLDTVTEAEAIDLHCGCRQDPEHTAAASALAELLEGLSRDSDADARLFYLTDTAFSSLDAAETVGLPLLLAAGLLKQSAQAGFMPALAACACCGREYLARADGDAFSFAQGGVLCADCQESGGDKGTLMPSGQAAWLELILRSRFSDLMAYATADYQPIGQGCLSFCQDWIACHITRRLRSLDFFFDLE